MIVKRLIIFFVFLFIIPVLSHAKEEGIKVAIGGMITPSPIVVHPKLDINLKNKLKEIFLNIHNDEKGRYILDKMMIDKFVTGKDSDYDSIREMEKFISKKNNK